jgi:hypothetical protein
MRNGQYEVSPKKKAISLDNKVLINCFLDLIESICVLVFMSFPQLASCNQNRKEKRRIPENVEARQETTADEILIKCNRDMLYAMLTSTNSNGRIGAPSQPATSHTIHCQPS